MSYATLTEAWGNYNPHENFANPGDSDTDSDSDSCEGFTNQYNNNNHENFWNHPTIKVKKTQPPKRKQTKQQPKKTVVVKSEPVPQQQTNSDFKSDINKEIEDLKSEIGQLKELIKNQNNIISGKSIAFNRNIHDIILFIIFGLFIILTLDGIFKLACKANKKYLVI